MEFLKVIPKQSGIYAIYSLSHNKKSLLYIGSSSNLRNRINQYDLDKYLYSSIDTVFGIYTDVIIKFKVIKEYGRWLMEEAKLIRKLNPPKNVYHKEKLNG